jgi:hypothetical protein
MKLRQVLLFGAAAGFWAMRAAAQSDTELALAETLYRQARDLMAAGNYAEACPKLKESYRVDPATGTLLNLAACHEAEGKFASAWREYSDAVMAARRDRRPDRVKYAEEHMLAIEQKVSRLTLVVPPESDLPDLELKLDGVVIGRAARGVAMPVDPGEHVVEASAPGKVPWTSTLKIGAAADAQTVAVPPLVAQATQTPPPTAVVVAPPPSPAVTPRAAEPGADTSARPIPLSVYVAGGATIALGAASIVTGALYLDRRANYEDLPAIPENDAARESEHDSAQTYGVLNAVFLIGTAAGSALTGYFYVTRPEERRAAVTLAPFAAPGSFGLVTRGEF